jgi:gamma-glutamyltranspeptidase/glutathione hydrolase
MSRTKTTRHAVAATPHPACAAAAKYALARGGNAVDAACAAMFAACVVLPASTGFAGYGGTMVAHLAGRGAVALDFDSRAPREYRDDLFDGKPDAHKLGYLSVSAPGVVAGLDAAIRNFGKLDFREALAPALALAVTGFRVDARQHEILGNWKAKTDAVSLKAFFPTGNLPAKGDMWTQPDLARFIQRMMAEGPGTLYRGDIARQIVRQVREHGGILTEEDLATYEPMLVEPITVTYRGHEVFTPMPPAGGLTSLQILKAMEQFDVGSMEPHGAEHFHTLAEVMKACWRDREQHLGDPDVVNVPMAEMLSERRGKAIADGVRRGSDTPRPAAATIGSDHTVNVLTADRDGNAVSLTATQGELFGSGVVVDGLGLVLGHGMSRFDFGKPGHPNAPAPGKRMHHNMSPMVILKGGRPRFLVGMPGGLKIPNVSAQIAMNLIDFGRTPMEAVRGPKVQTTGEEPLHVSMKTSRGTIDGLRRMGHKVKRTAKMGGPANAMSIDPAGGATTGGSEAGIRSVAHM